MGTHDPGKKVSASSPLKRILSGYLGILGRILGMILILALAAACGTLIVFPLWAFATGSPYWYSVFVGAVIASAVVYAAVRRFVRKLGEYRNPTLFLSHSVLPVLKKVLTAIAAIALLYGILLLYANSMQAAGIVATVLYLLLAGYLLFVRRPARRIDQSR